MLRQIYADAVDVGPCYGSTQRSTDHLAGGEEACSECCPLSKNLDPGLSYLAISPPFFSSIPSFVFLKISPAMFFLGESKLPRSPSTMLLRHREVERHRINVQCWCLPRRRSGWTHLPVDCSTPSSVAAADLALVPTSSRRHEDAPRPTTGLVPSSPATKNASPGVMQLYTGCNTKTAKITTI